MYAEDTECESATKSEDYKEFEATINDDLYRVKEYFGTNNFNLNVPKCVFMLVGTYHYINADMAWPTQFLCDAFNANHDTHNHNTINVSLRVTKHSKHELHNIMVALYSLVKGYGTISQIILNIVHLYRILKIPFTVF